MFGKKKEAKKNGIEMTGIQVEYDKAAVGEEVMLRLYDKKTKQKTFIRLSDDQARDLADYIYDTCNIADDLPGDPSDYKEVG